MPNFIFILSADFNLDGRSDIVCASNASMKLRWYESLGE